MNTKNIFSILLLLIGEALIIISFLYFGSNLASEILTLDTIVSTILYSLFFIDILIPMVDFKDKSQRVIGSLGLRWFVTSLYTLSAIGMMIIFFIGRPADFTAPSTIHAVLFISLSPRTHSAAT